MNYTDIADLLADQAQTLLEFSNPKVNKELLTLPGPNFVDQVFGTSDRSTQVLENLKKLFNHGRLNGTGYLSILPVDQGVEHTAAVSFAPNPDYFDPENIIKLAIEGGANAVASTYGVLAMMAKKYADQIPFIVKINHNELLTYPSKHDQILFASVKQAADMGAVAVGATIYFGSAESNRQIQEISQTFAQAHEMGLATILWCYTRNPAFTKDGINYETSADITGQADYLGATIGADIVKQKMPETQYGFKTIGFGKFDDQMYEKLSSDHPIDLTRYQVLHGFAGRIGLINSGGASGDNDLQQAVTTAVINKRAGGMGLISGRKAFSKPLKEGVAILNAIQDVYLAPEITVA